MKNLLQRLVTKISKDPLNSTMERYTSLLGQINAKVAAYKELTDQDIKHVMTTVRREAGPDKSIESILTDVFPLVIEAATRSIELRPYDVQVIAGIAMSEGHLVEMNTGEGKTLAAVFPAALHAISGKGVHILTFNDYLAERDAAWMGPIYERLGLTVGFVKEGMCAVDRKIAYEADITYVTAREAGFDFLRAQLAYEPEELVQRPFHMAIVDEADSIMIDEARVPLIIAGDEVLSDTMAYKIADVAQCMTLGKEFQSDEYGRNIQLTDTGVDYVEGALNCGDLYASDNISLLTSLHLALHAAHLLQKDVDYIIRDGKIELVDDFTGRVAERRQWPNGLQAAVEAKEGVAIHPESRILGSITLQHFLRQYPNLAGMTATARSAEDEFKEFYGLDIASIPPNRPCIRIDHPDLVFTHRDAKHNVLIKEITDVHKTGRPILVGTASVEESDQLSVLLQSAGISHNILNAREDAKEAAVIAEAGARGAVTISTNMAGRGTDIRLGGQSGEHHDQIAALGGLYVIGTNRHESRRIDNQLRGRAGRQGDPGESRFYISLEDDLLVKYGLKSLVPEKYWPQEHGRPVDHPVLTREIVRAQRIIENQNFEIRKTVWKYSEVVEAQRKIIQDWRRSVLNREADIELWRNRRSDWYTNTETRIGRDNLSEAERIVTMYQIDKCWSDYLEYISHTRDSIHLVSLGGEQPIDSFHKVCATAFSELFNRIDGEILNSIDRLEISDRGIDLNRSGIKRPSSTWTYQVNDTPFSNTLQSMLVGNQNIGMAAGGTLILGWLLFIVGIRRWFSRK